MIERNFIEAGNVKPTIWLIKVIAFSQLHELMHFFQILQNIFMYLSMYTTLISKIENKAPNVL